MSREKDVIYILTEGSSPDGRGHPSFQMRTTSKSVAKKHFRKCHNNGYSTGGVTAYTDTEEIYIWREDQFDEF